MRLTCIGHCRPVSTERDRDRRRFTCSGRVDAFRRIMSPSRPQPGYQRPADSACVRALVQPGAVFTRCSRVGRPASPTDYPRTGRCNAPLGTGPTRVSDTGSTGQAAPVWTLAAADLDLDLGVELDL